RSDLEQFIVVGFHHSPPKHDVRYASRTDSSPANARSTAWRVMETRPAPRAASRISNSEPVRIIVRNRLFTSINSYNPMRPRLPLDLQRAHPLLCLTCDWQRSSIERCCK